MEAKKVFYTSGSLSAAVLLLLTACGAKSQITTTIESCGGQEEVDAQPGVLRKMTAPGITIEYMVNPDGSLTWFSKPPFTDIPPFTGRPLGKITEKHLLIDLQGDTDGDGGQNAVFKSVCPDPLPKPSETPIGLLKGNVRSITQINRGFHPGDASKPVFSGRIRF